MKFSDIFPDIIETKRTQRTKKKRLPREPKVKTDKSRHHSNPVVCLDSGQRFVSIKEAAIATGANASTIGACCRGVKLTAGGYKWQYLHRATHRVKNKSLNAGEYRSCLDELISQYFDNQNSESSSNLFLINREHRIELMTSSAKKTLTQLSLPINEGFSFSYSSLEKIYAQLFGNLELPEHATALVNYIRRILELQRQVFDMGIAVAFVERLPQDKTTATVLMTYLPLIHETGEVVGALVSFTSNVKLPFVEGLSSYDDEQLQLGISARASLPVIIVLNEEIRESIKNGKRFD